MYYNRPTSICTCQLNHFSSKYSRISKYIPTQHRHALKLDHSILHLFSQGPYLKSLLSICSNDNLVCTCASPKGASFNSVIHAGRIQYVNINAISVVDLEGSEPILSHLVGISQPFTNVLSRLHQGASDVGRFHKIHALN